MPRPKTVDLDALIDGVEVPRRRDIGSVGPSDSSDTGADMIGTGGLDTTSDRNGTGERASVENEDEAELDIAADGIVEAADAGLGGGLDQAEEAQLGVTDEEIAAAIRKRLGLDH